MTCKKCNGTGWFKYDENHGQICDECCPHDKGFWELKEHYGKNNGKMCCLRGCGFTRKKTAGDFVKSHRVYNKWYKELWWWLQERWIIWRKK